MPPDAVRPSWAAEEGTVESAELLLARLAAAHADAQAQVERSKVRKNAIDFEGNMRSNVLSQTGYMLIQNNEDRWGCKFASEISAKYHREEIQEAAQNIHVGVKEPNTVRGCDGFFEEIIHGDLSIYSQNYFDLSQI